MFGRKAVRLSSDSVPDIEMQQNAIRQRNPNHKESDDTTHLGALETLFGFTSDQMRQVEALPKATSWCLYLEDCFKPLLVDQYSSIWVALGLAQPRAVTECWPFFRFICHAISKLDDTGYSIEDVWKLAKAVSGMDMELNTDPDIYRETSQSTTDDESRQECLVAVFAVLCWGSMIVQPRLTRNGAVATPCLAIHQLPTDQVLKIDFARRPILAVFQGFQKALYRRGSTREAATHESTILYVSKVNYHSLRTMGKK
ncbi:hypothetical protein PENSOL_c023G09734 [Penicillium solitum]|uniref:Uncharacterized protein n=1 Tax=Penicillium solitum TaxID=60172 RepID=A0A1V6R0K7_9EURO|nr:uncharacterized protein PENSOL_c023G09734 [Penicillium solitum]OQD94901.1 hypothetical protein PENSOL_c023G09734 [Penicillium solitum]